MNAQQVLAAWKEAQTCQTHPFYERFWHLTGLTEAQVKWAFSQWNLTRHDRVEEIAIKHGVTVEEGGFQAFLVEWFWSEDPEMQVLLRVEKYLRTKGHQDAADELSHLLGANARLGRFPINFLLTGSPSPVGDPREGRGDWPPEEDCPCCPTGRKDDINSPHKMSCSWAKGVSGRLTIPASMGADGRVHVRLPGEDT